MIEFHLLATREIAQAQRQLSATLKQERRAGKTGIFNYLPYSICLLLESNILCT
jgi:hypothetical protein